jgi:hypothetical protein
MHTRCAGFPVAGLGLRYSVFGPRRESGTRYRVPGARYRAPDSVFGLRFSALGLDKECGKVVSPLPLIPPWPRTEHRAPKTEPGPWKTRPSGLHPASWESRTQAIAYCPTALLPYCPTALLPYCLTACPTASPPPIGLTRPTGLAMIGVEASRDQVPRIGVKRERGANPLRSRRRDRGRKRRYATGSGHPVPPGKAARVGRSGSRKTCLVLLTGLLRGERP